jgi:DNA polymerase (family X)
MPVQNADLLEIDGANQFRVRAYRTAARNIANLPHSLADMILDGKDLSELPGIGQDLAGKITEIITRGRLTELESITKRLPAGLIDITRVAGLGPKRAGVLYRELGIASVGELEKAARAEQVRELPGFASKMEQTILADIERRGGGQAGKRLKLSVAQELARPLLAYLEKVKGVKRVEAARSYRRGMETVGDLDVLVTHASSSDVMERFVGYEDVERVISKGPTRATVVLRFGLQVDLRAVPEESYGAALHYFTGSKAHNVAVRLMGVKKGLKINEYGVFKGDKRIAGRTETEVYEQVGLPYIEPELREDRGELEAALKGKLPKLIEIKDIKGDLHCHTEATDGHASLEEMAEAARKRGYRYLAVTDHSKRLAMTRGLDEKRLAAQMKEVDRLNKKLDGFTILKAIEVDILEDGSLDLPPDALKDLDLLVCSVHHKFNLPRDVQTERIIRAIGSRPTLTILGHPSGRLIPQRKPYDIDMEKVMRAARDCGCVIELNAQPERLDLTDIDCQMARDMGVMVAISTDAHSPGEFDFMRFGVTQARRGWLEAANVINTRSLAELKKRRRQV